MPDPLAREPYVPAPDPVYGERGPGPTPRPDDHTFHLAPDPLLALSIDDWMAVRDLLVMSWMAYRAATHPERFALHLSEDNPDDVELAHTHPIFRAIHAIDTFLPFERAPDRP
jgi:hypothetical protein